MSMETAEWLNGGNILVGMGQRPWWADDAILAGLKESPLYDGPIPIEDVERRLFNFTAKAFQVASLRPTSHNYKGSQPVVTIDGTKYRVVTDADRIAVGPNDADDTFGVFSSGYDVENHQFGHILLEQVSDILDTGDLAIESAGLLKNRAVGWVQVSIPHTITTQAGIEFRPRLLAATGLDGTMASGWDRVYGLTVCDNTLAAARMETTKSGLRVRVRHTKHSKMRLAEARDALAIVYDMGTSFAKEMDALAAEKVTDAQWEKVLDALVPLPEAEGKGMTMAETKRNELTLLWHDDERVSPWHGSSFGVLQAFNTYRQHVAHQRGNTHRFERNMLNVLSGSEAEEDMKVLSTVRSLVSA